MPHPKSTPKPGKPPSKEVVPLGRRDVFKNSGAGRPETFKERPTTTRALVLRNGKYGAMGSGEVILLSKIGGREKLDLLAEDYTAKAAKAVATPFRLEQCVKIAESQLNVYLDGINTLKDSGLFADKIRDEVRARKSGSDRNPSFVASVVGSTIHNLYMLASAWSLVWEWLVKLAEYGLEDTAVRARLRRDETFRSIYLVLYRLVQVIADAEQKKFAALAPSAEHFSRYFKLTEDEAEDPEWLFDWTSLKTMHKSFLDSIVVELCLPNSQYSKQILLQLLEEATTESPKETKRFPQALWDAVGDFSVTVQMLAIVEAPLLGPEGEALKKLPHGMPDEYETWVDAQLFSAKASQQYANYKDVIFPLERAKTKQTLDTMWRYVNLNYKAVSGLDIDTLWDLKARFKEQTPQFHGYYIPGADEESEKVVPGAFPARSSRQVPGPNVPLDDSDDEPPELQSVSQSSEGSRSDSEWESGDEHWDDDDWDTEDEEEIIEHYREMMKVGMEHPDFLDPRVPIPEFDKYAEERKDNPFLKLLGSLRGRMFSSGAALRTTDRPAPRKQTTAPGQRSTKATVEDVEDEGDGGRPTAPKKKKKKKSKKKKPATASAENEGQETVIESISLPGPETVTTPPLSPASPTHEPRQSQSNVASPSKKKKKKPSSGHSNQEPRNGLNIDNSLNASTSTFAPQLPAYASTTSLPLPEPQRAQSARSYVRAEGLAEKAKVKSRPNEPTLEPIKEKKGFWSKFSRKEKKDEKTEEEDVVPRENWAVRMKEQTKTYMRQMIGTKDGLQPMKWEVFLKIMREMGFEMDPSTAGSSVRFDPPNPKDKSIHFHKPHPDPTLSPYKVREFGRRLRNTYGWIEDDFTTRAGGKV